MPRFALLLFAVIVVLALLYYTPVGTPPAASPRSYASDIEACRRLFRDKTWSRGGAQIGAVLDTLFSDLLVAGANAPDDAKLACFRRAETALNALYDRRAIGTEDAAELFYLGQMVAMTARLDFKKYTKIETPSPLVIGHEWPNGPLKPQPPP